MVKQPGKPAKLRAKAGEARYLVPFAVDLAQEFKEGGEHRRTVANLMLYLGDVVNCLAEDPYPVAEAAESSRKFSQLYLALWKEGGEGDSWKVKPKLHLFQELLEFTAVEAGTLRNFWTYRDEDWGGWLAKSGARRAGAAWAANVSLNLVNRFRALTQDLAA